MRDRVMTTIFGYRTVVGIPKCPYCSPGTYMMMEHRDGDELKFRFLCWCGAKTYVIFDDLEELRAFLELNKDKEDDEPHPT